MEEEAIKPLPYLPGPLPFPSQDFQPPLNVDLPLSDQLLDERAWLHLNEMLSQSLGNLKLSPAITSVWLDSLTNCLHSLEDILTPTVLSAIAESRIAEWKVKEAKDVALRKSPEKKKGKEKEKEKELPVVDEKALAKARAARRVELKQARELLVRETGTASPASTAINLPDVSPNPSIPSSISTLDESSVEPSLTPGTGAAKKSDAGGDDSAWMTVEALPKLTHFRLMVETTATTLGAVKGGLTMLGASFTPGEFKGVSLFGRDVRHEVDEEDLQNLNLVGGTFKLTSIAKDTGKLERVLELLAFATLTLKLECHLMRDTHCPRPSVESDLVSEFGTEASISTPISEHSAALSEVSSLAESKVVKSHRSKWSGTSLWGFITGVASNSTRPSTTSPPSSPRKKVKDKIRDGLRLRRTRSSRREGSSASAHRRTSMDVDALDAWDYLGGLGLGLGIGGSAALQSSLETPEPREDGKTESKLTSEKEEPAERFQRVIKQMEKCVLSVSPDVVYPPPHLLVRLRKQEIEQLEIERSLPPPKPPVPPKPVPLLSPFSAPSRPFIDRLRSYTPIDAQTLAMGFASGHAPLPEPGTSTMSSTTSRATRITLDARAGLSSLMTNNNSLGGTIRHQGMQFLMETVPNSVGEATVPCKPPKWLSFGYYSTSPSPIDSGTSFAPDITLGQLLERLANAKDDPCETPGCKKTGLDHIIHWMHSKERISLKMSMLPSSATLSPEVESFLEPTRPRITSWTTCRACHAMTLPTVLSLATYLFSYAQFCELAIYDPHFIPYPDICEHASQDPNVLVRSFALGRVVISIELDPIELFELRLPTAVDPDIVHEVPIDDSDTSSSSLLQLEIGSFYKSVATRIDVLLERLNDSQAPSTLKRPSDTAQNHLSSSGLAQRPRSSSEVTIQEDEEPVSTVKADNTSPLRLLQKLQNGFEDDEADLLSTTGGLPSHQLNNGRWDFLTKVAAAKARLEAWEKKHAASIAGEDPNFSLPPHTFAEPEYAQPGTYAFPIDSSVLVREHEISSVIAFALSARAFQDEVTAPTIGMSRRVTPHTTIPAASRKSSRQPIPMELLDPSLLPSSPDLFTGSTAITPPRSPRFGFHIPATVVHLDPDDPTADFEKSVEIECVAKPKKDARTGSLILGMRGAIARQASSDSFGFFRGSPLPTPSSDGPQLGEERRSVLSDSVLEDLVTTSQAEPPVARKSQPASSRALPQIMSGVTKRLVSEPRASPVTTGEAEFTPVPERGSISSLSSLDSKNASTTSIVSSSIGEDDVTQTEDQDQFDEPVAPLEPAERTGSRIVSALWNLPASIRRGPVPRQPDAGTHIKLCFRHGDKYFRVTAYFAQRFQTLRTQCGLSESLFIESLARCRDLNPAGGKSKAGFWITHDSRFMLKELTTIWGVSEKDAFLTFAPELLNYLMAPERPSLLAKIFGFYSVKIRNLKTGETKKLDLVVMEHLFHSQTITRQFDLKGVASRVAKPKAGTSDNVGWDADFLNGSIQSRLLIYSHSKTLLRNALLNDSNFLSKAGNIDYSLLVGVDDSRKELVVGLIDTLGVFNTLKMLESAGKTALKKATASDADAVTVLPPQDYAARFRQGLETAFLAVPEKFSRVQGAEDLDPDPRLAIPL